MGAYVKYVGGREGKNFHREKLNIVCSGRFYDRIYLKNKRIYYLSSTQK